MKKIITLFAIIFGVFFLSFGFWFYSNSKPVSIISTKTYFIVNKGDGIKTISSRLVEQKIIKNKYIFIFYAKKNGLASDLKAGRFEVDSSKSVTEIITSLTKGGSTDYWIKIIDGSRLEEISAVIPSEAAFIQKEFEIKAKQYSGHLFPDSYLVPNYYTVDQTISLILNNFDKKLIEAKKDASNTNISDNDALILASLIEREARTLESKRYVAGILLNRTKLNMPLQLDATAQFARDSKIPRPKEYWLPVYKNDLAIDSPYNTYKNTGLTPGPICNPGFNSLYAVYHPIESDYIFYITGNDNLMHYAKTLSEHNLNIEKYLR